MRLTVGPHPAAVYWRRRAVVLVGLAIIVLIVSYACGATNRSNADPQAGTSPSTTSTLLRPTSQSPKPSGKPVTTPKPTPTPTAFTLPTATTASGPCTDDEISVTVKASTAQVDRGTTVPFTIAFKNTSSRTCARDIGADMQEIRLLDGDTIVWSSDDCSPNRGHDQRSFAAGQTVQFTLNWAGHRSRTGTDTKVCTNQPLPDAKDYQLVGRLGQKLSNPFALEIRA